MEPEGRRRRHRRSRRDERMMWERYQGAAYSVSIVESSEEGGGCINGNSVGVDPENRILGLPSACLMGVSVRIGLGTPKLGGVGTCIALPGSRGETNSFLTPVWGGGRIN